MVSYTLLLTCIVAALWRVSGEPQTLPSPATQLNSTTPSVSGGGEVTSNVTDAAVGSRISSLQTHLPTLKNIVIFICVLTAVLIICLVVKVVRWAGWRGTCLISVLSWWSSPCEAFLVHVSIRSRRSCQTPCDAGGREETSGPVNNAPTGNYSLWALS